MFFDYDNKKIVFNSFTCVLGIVDDEFIDLYSQINNLDDKQIQSNEEKLNVMKKGGYIIDDSFDEIDYMKFVYQKSAYDSDVLKLTIIPTYSCNFACPYCYEGNYTERKDNLFMSLKVEEAIAQLCEKYAQKGKNIDITWYGGEPLLAKNTIWNLSKKIKNICAHNHVELVGSMITNGYLIDDATIEKIKESQIKAIQISLDGPPDIHDKSRKLKCSSEGTFYVLIDNVKKLRKNDIKVGIRIHANKENEPRLDELFNILANENLTDCLISVALVRNFAKECSKGFNNFLDERDFAGKQLNYIQKLLRLGFNASIYPQFQFDQPCVANSNNAYMIGPEGNLFACWVDAGKNEKKIGNIFELIKEETKKSTIYRKYYIKNVLSSPFDNEECLNCKILPICVGGCPTIAKRLKRPDCSLLKYNLLDVLKFEYNCKKNKIELNK